MNCPTDLQQAFLDGEFIDSLMCVYMGDDPAMQIMVPTAVYGVVLLAMFLSSDSIIIPAVVGIILGGVMLAIMPAPAMGVIAIAVALFLTVGVFVLARRSSI